jgi:hypothetical protein
MNPIDIVLPSLPFVPVAGVASASNAMRKLRNQTLQTDVDSINPVRYELLTEEQRQELRIYRQALLDLPQQATWPNNVVWPTKPAWM